MTENQRAILKRLTRKIEIMHLDLKAANNTRYHDTDEMLLLTRMLKESDEDG